MAPLFSGAWFTRVVLASCPVRVRRSFSRLLFFVQLQAGYLPLPDPLPSERTDEQNVHAETGAHMTGTVGLPSSFTLSVPPPGLRPLKPSSGEAMGRTSPPPACHLHEDRSMRVVETDDLRGVTP